MKPRILQVVLDMQYVGEKVVAALAKGLLDDFEVMFCCLDKIGLLGESLQREGLCVTALGRKPGFDSTLPFKIARFAKEKKIDVIQAHHYTPFFYSALSRFLYHRPRLIFTEHGRDFPDIVKLQRKAVNLALNLVTDHITAVSEHSKRGLIRNDCLPASKITVIYNGIEPVSEKNLAANASHREILEWIGSSEKVLGFLARLEWIKNPELLIDAFAETVKWVPDAKLLIMGKGDLMSALKERCSRLAIDELVFFAGLVKNPLPLIPKLRALVLTSLSEAASLSILEGMMCGIPVIASDVGGNPELVKNGKTGCLVPSGDVHGFADAMVRILTDERAARLLGETARADALQRFSVSAMIEAFRVLYLDLLSK